MGRNPIVNAVTRGIVLQAAMVAAGTFVPAIGQMPNFYAIAGTVLAGATGAMVSWGSPGLGAAPAMRGGAIAGGSSSLIGGIFAALSGQWPGFQALQLLYPLISGGVSGGVGGLLGRMRGAHAAVR